ncbi:phospholipase D-like domain-containing protein [Accumulibacter sp.]|uniref:phospholipase D-like domain-containing protein n=1 Tax=Accumulibacter sp. TaxID=2053492 RepID=UPI0025F123C9|nr:phospholipase D-like domain-containing protein [Accumulibacter sp.]MCM8613747.1 phospholipase D-like domain-containing protein [Accumulibacter sp.]MCM8637976.1 phospholipase D-like domain-containing protein [Accumulibacter sp.]MCM8641313.1 phospholipase D-like domain-containing protein [Accumulibacter sp.]
MYRKISLIVQPGDSFFPIVRAIDRAERSINLTVFRMDDPIIQRALIEARQRGVHIRVLISSSARGWEERNRRLLKDATEAGIDTREPAGDSRRARYHYKVMTVDETEAFVFTFNPTRDNLHYARDFGVEVYSPSIAAEINRLFDADWADQPFNPDQDSPLLVSPFNSRRKMETLLAGARSSIHIADAKLSDPAMLRLLMKKARSGIQVRVLGDETQRRALPPGVEFQAVPRYRLHAKCSIVDGVTAVIGSMNLRTESLDRRRELSIMVDDAELLQGLNAVFAGDWEHRAPLPDSTATQVLRQSQIGAAGPLPSAAGGFVLISRSNPQLRHVLRAGMNTVGRAQDNDVVIGSARVSRYHARISLDDGVCTLSDLASGNGTFLNGERIGGSSALNAGDVVRIADSDEFRFLEL